MPRPVVDKEKDVLKLIRLDRRAWSELEPVVKAYKTSRTDAINRAITWMVQEHFIPGYIKKERV